MNATRYLLIFLFGVFFLGCPVLFAQTQSVAERKQALENQLTQIEAEMETQKTIISTKQKEGETLAGDIAILNAKIKKADLSIRARDITIGNLVDDIGQKKDTIGTLGNKMDRERQSLAQLIRRTNEIDDSSLTEVVFSNQGISDFFSDLDAFDAIKLNLKNSFESLQITKTQNEEEKAILEDKRQEEESLRKAQELERTDISRNRATKDKLLKDTKGQEKLFQQMLKGSQKDAAKIRAELFTLSGSAAIPFAKALDIAQRAERKTGVRAAFILGIVAEESNLGQNVGKGTWTVDMHPTRDVPVFRQLTAELGLDPDKMPVSKKVWYGYGGAMGPAQFIPSTWVLYKDRIAAMTGHTPPNPWDPEDAFMATAIYSKDNGADAQTPNAEFRAAMCYLAGCGNAKKKSLQFYGEDVADLAIKYQKQIDILGGK